MVKIDVKIKHDKYLVTEGVRLMARAGTNQEAQIMVALLTETDHLMRCPLT
jgi:hypothetical protein